MSLLFKTDKRAHAHLDFGMLCKVHKCQLGSAFASFVLALASHMDGNTAVP